MNVPILSFSEKKTEPFPIFLDAIGRRETGQLLRRTFGKGENVYMPGEPADYLYCIREGRVKACTYHESGKEITKSILGPGEIFGELALIGERRRRDFVFALEPVSVSLHPVNQIQSLMRRNSDLSLSLMEMIGTRLLDMEQRLEALTFKKSRTRIIEFLQDLAYKKGQPVGFEIIVRKFITHQEIANFTATSRQNVTTVLNELRAKNILTFNRRRLLIRDMERLAGEAV